MSLSTIVQNAVRIAVREILDADLPGLVATALRSILEQELRPAVCSILESELSNLEESAPTVAPPSEDNVPRPVRRRRSDATPEKSRSSRPRLASKYGVEVGQKWEAKDYKPSLVGRVIKVQELHRDVLIPEIITAANGKTRTTTKPISYKTLNHAYKLMVD